MKREMRRQIMAVSGVMICGASVGIFQKIALGTDPFTCFVTGIANVFHSTYSTWYVILTGLMLLGVIALQRRYIGFATLINLFLTGVAADAMHGFLDFLLPDPTFGMRCLLMAVNVLIMSFGSALYYVASLGVSAYDAVALMASECYSLASFRVCRVTTDICCVTVGFFLAADVGIGTVITAFFMGPFVQWFTEHVAIPILDGRCSGRNQQFRPSKA